LPILISVTAIRAEKFENLGKFDSLIKINIGHGITRKLFTWDGARRLLLSASAQESRCNLGNARQTEKKSASEDARVFPLRMKLANARDQPSCQLSLSQSTHLSTYSI
jgi:hypothetical protein